MNRFLISLLAFTLLAVSAVGDAKEGNNWFIADFFASPSGSGSGCSEQAPCSLSTVIATVRGMPGGKHIVALRGGTYYQTSLALTSADNGSSGTPIIYKAYPGEIPVLSGGRETRVSGGVTIK